MRHAYCAKHANYVLEGEHCPGCFQELPPEARVMAAKSRFWSRAHAGLVALAGVVMTLAVYAFCLFREWVIWTR